MEMTSETIYKNRWIILLNLVLVTFMATLDSSIVNVALPVMAKKLSVSMASIGWVVTSYLIIISSTILIFGRIGDIKGKVNVFKFGIIFFTIGSLMCGLSHSLFFLVISRAVQAIGAAATMATNQGIITQIFPSNERGRALGFTGTFVALGSMVGPPLGGIIVSAFSWEYIFLINIPIGIFTYLMTLKTLPTIKKEATEKLDLKGSILIVVTIVALFGSLTQGQEVGFNNPLIIAGIVTSLIALVIFILTETKVNSPLLDLAIFKNKLFSLSIFCGFLSFVCISSSNIIQPFYLQDVLKFTPSTTGMIMVVSPIFLAIIAPISGYFSDKIGSESLTLLGLSISSLGLFLMSTLNEFSTLPYLITFVIVMTLGNGMFQSPNTSLIMSTVSKDKLGVAGSVNALVRNLGMVFGISFSTTLLYNRMSYKVGYRVVNYVPGREDIFVYGMKIVYISVALICLIGVVLTGIRLYRKKRPKIAN